MASKKLFDFIEYDNLAMILLFVLFGIIIYKKINRTKENFNSIDNDDLGAMLNDIDQLDFSKLKEFEKKLTNKEEENNNRNNKLKDIIGSNENHSDFLPMDLDQSFDDLIDDEDDELEDEMESNNLRVSTHSNNINDEEDIDFGFINKKPNFKVGQLLMKSDLKKLQNIIEDETDGPLSDSIIGNAEGIIADEQAHRVIGERKILDKHESGFLNKLMSVRDGIDKIQTNVKKISKIDIKDKLSKLSDEELERRFKKNNVGIFNQNNLGKLIDKSDKLFKYNLDSLQEGQPLGVNDEVGYKELDSDEPVDIKTLDNNLNSRPSTLEDAMERPGKYSDDSLLEDEHQFDETRYKSINEIDGQEDNTVKFLDATNDILSLDNESDQNEDTTEIESDSELSSIYDNSFKNPVNVTPIDDIQYDNRLVDSPEPECSKDGTCSFRKDKKKTFSIDSEGVKSRLHTNVNSGTFIEPSYIDDITHTQMKLEESTYDLDIKKLNDLRNTKKYDGPIEIKKVYEDSISKPVAKKSNTSVLAQNNLDLNKSHSNYYSFNPNAPVRKNVSSDSITAFDDGFSAFSKY
jgi:hypothetical protein